MIAKTAFALLKNNQMNQENKERPSSQLLTAAEKAVFSLYQSILVLRMKT